MPIYEYICEDCSEEFEVIQKFSEKPLSQCFKCGEKSLKKKTSASAFHLKGGGWYKDGYGDKSENSSSSNDTSTGSAQPANDKKSSDSSKSETSNKSAESADISKQASDSGKKKASSSQSLPKAKAS